jgi:hypothetical protein
VDELSSRVVCWPTTAQVGPVTSHQAVDISGYRGITGVCGCQPTREFFVVEAEPTRVEALLQLAQHRIAGPVTRAARLTAAVRW